MSILRDMEQLLIGHVTGGAVIGNEASLWIQTPGFYPTQEEMNIFIDAFDMTENELSKGIIFQSDRYLVVENQNGVIVAKNIFGALVLCRCKSCVVFAYIESVRDFNEGYEAAIKLAEWIRSTPASELK